MFQAQIPLKIRQETYMHGDPGERQYKMLKIVLNWRLVHLKVLKLKYY